MILPQAEYRKARSVEEALALFYHYEGRAAFLAGGTDLIPRMKLRLAKPLALIDLKGIEELRGVREEGDWVRIGPLTTLYDLRAEELIREEYPTLFESLEATSCETLQMRGTLGGNLLQESRCLFYNQSEFWRKAKGFCLKMGGERCNATGGTRCLSNYASDNAPALLSLGARLRTVGPQGEREFSLEELYTGRGERPLGLSPGEILVEVLLPRGRTKGGYEKLRVRGAIDYPLLGVAFTVRNGERRLALGAVGPRPISFPVQDLEEAAERASAEVSPIPNTVLSPPYIKRMAKVLSMRVMRRVLEEG
ncbi:MAG: 4-hydroxybenzoyl-CoA reductase subunit beta [Deltaproteobacteria bacterium]|nr:MAG: 4-hydroxybenzoyl-CoA reductase subunit beta [Deltaproteobacteria bacterium]